MCISLIRTEVAARGNLARPTNKQVCQRKVVEYAARQFTSYVITRLHPIVGESTEKLLLWMWESYHHSVQYHLMKWKSWKEWSTKASDASKRSSLVLSNPRCLISQIAVTFEGDRAGVRGEAGPGGTFFLFFLKISVCFAPFRRHCFWWCARRWSSCALPPLNKSFSKYEPCCLQHFSAFRRCPLSLSALPLCIWRCLLSYLPSASTLGGTIPPLFMAGVVACRRMLHAQAYACI